jgi:hypothetical protein
MPGKAIKKIRHFVYAAFEIDAGPVLVYACKVGSSHWSASFRATCLEENPLMISGKGNVTNQA